MTAKLALDLTVERLSLLQRSSMGWDGLGHVPLESKTFQQDVTELFRSNGLGTETPPEARPSVLVSLPADQVFYLEVPIADLPEYSERSRQVSTWMMGKTAYAPSDLRIDWVDKGELVQIAATPLETLEEAETFVQAFGLVPAGATARPRRKAFAGVPWFGRVADRARHSHVSAAALPDGLPLPDLAVRDRASLSSPPRFTPDAAEATGIDVSQIAAATSRAHVSQIKFEASRANARLAAQSDPKRQEPAPPEELEDPKDKATVEKITRAAMVKPASALRPRRLLLLTAVLCLILALVAVFYTGSDTRVPDAELGDVTLSDPVAPIQEASLTQSSDTAGAEAGAGEDQADLADLIDQQGQAYWAASDALIEVPDLDLTEDGDIQSSPAFYTPTQGLTRSVDPGDLNALQMPGLDETMTVDALALATPNDVPLSDPDVALQPPNPAVDVFDVDERGLVRPSPEGTVSPDGIPVFAGPPPSAPKPRPVREAEALPEELNFIDPSKLEDGNPLKTLRPRSRPNGLQETYERSVLGGRTQSELATLRPKARPASLQELNKSTAPSALAVATGPKPRARPAAQARAFAQKRANTPPPEVIQKAAVTTPTAPTPKRVSKSATRSSTMNLNEVNLLGTYGPSGKQRALVRLPSGRVLNVSVGDRMDGGRVAAISQGQLRYVKSGRSVTLNMPRG